ncbi:hypothetical protein CerSpe_216170 [Prunus speciosa]
MFSNSTAGNDTQKTYSFYLYRRNVTYKMCKDCVAFETQYLNKTCVGHTQGVVWYHEWILRYADQNIFSFKNHVAGTFYCNPTDVSDVLEYDIKLSVLIEDLFFRAAYGSSKPSFAIGETRINNDTMTIYGLAQCTLDRIGNQCIECLKANYNGMLKVIARGSYGEWLSCLATNCGLSRFVSIGKLLQCFLFKNQV